MKVEFGIFDIPPKRGNHYGSRPQTGSLVEHFICFDMAYKDKKMMKVECETDQETRSVTNTLRERIKRCEGAYDVFARDNTVYVVRRDENAV